MLAPHGLLCLSLSPGHLEWCLAHRGIPKNMCWMNEWINGLMNVNTQTIVLSLKGILASSDIDVPFLMEISHCNAVKGSKSPSSHLNSKLALVQFFDANQSSYMWGEKHLTLGA